MGVIEQGLLGQFVNKVGSVVGRVRLGVNVMSIYQPNVSNPRTEAQQTQRLRFSLLAEMSSICGSFIAFVNRSLKGRGQTAQNVFMRSNFKAGAVTGTYPNLRIEFGNMVFGGGSLMGLYSPNAALVEDSLVIGWTDNSGEGNASTTDKINVILINSSKKASFVGLEAGERGQTTISLTPPAAWSGDAVEVYVVVTNLANTAVSESYYLGSINLE